ncbi:hypothetical protein [Paenibacillus ehimensis]|uniref:Uncharacterized protein n=1 Tax=Paenibacillus ehimensis TaxID=79264 RepID=A0ABT8VJX7_9BACL|nr:hypothetical protein [Paenibacillus ehimensis]MDO3681246.1 hypothetical protein [Paenibacillus ehimensis]MEC0212802.1 hypothetical protein [Paenibacillus ehimensis]
MKQPIDCQLLIEQLEIPLEKFEAWKKEQLKHMNTQSHEITMNESGHADHSEASLRPPSEL